MDIDLPSGQTRCQAGVLPLLADREGELVVRHNHAGDLLFRIDDLNTDNLGWGECVTHEVAGSSE